MKVISKEDYKLSKSGKTALVRASAINDFACVVWDMLHPGDNSMLHTWQKKKVFIRKGKMVIREVGSFYAELEA